MELPILKATIDENIEMDGVDGIALVDYPAIEVNWMKFDKTKTEIKLNLNEDKRIITGPIMIADKPIYRNDVFLGEYYIVYEKDTIEKMNKKFFMENKMNRINEMHDSTQMVKHVFVVESWLIKDVENDKSKALGFNNLTEGTWMMSYYIQDENYWNNNIKSGQFKGFSLEGFFDLEFRKDDPLNKFYEVLNDEKISEDEALQRLKKLL